MSNVPFHLSDRPIANPSCIGSEHLQEIEELPVDTVFVLGSGNFGMALAFHLAHHLNDKITIYARDEAVVQSINEKHINPKYLSEISLPENMRATSSISKEILDAHSVLLFCIPTQHMRSVLEKNRDAILNSERRHLCIFANKGIEGGTLQLPYEIIADVMGKEFSDRCVFLSGPSFAIEIVQRQPTCVTVASQNLDCALWAQRVL